MTAYLDELREVIRQLHGAEAHYIESVPVKEVFRGETVWEGVLEVFELRGHPTASKVYAWRKRRRIRRGRDRTSRCSTAIRSSQHSTR